MQVLCATGYCNTAKGFVGQGYNPTYSGTCSAGGPSIDTVYMQNCAAGQGWGWSAAPLWGIFVQYKG